MFICLKPQEKLVFLGKDCVKDVDFSSVATDVVSVEFDESKGLGVLAKQAPGSALVLETLESLNDYRLVLDLAASLLEAQNNPKTYYSTVDKPGLKLGAPILVTDVGWPQPPDTTEQAPLSQPDEYSQLYWNGRRFIWWSFPPDLTLAEAKERFIPEINKQAYIVLQPTDWYIIRQWETNQPIPENILLWRASVRTAASSKISQLDAVTSKVVLNTLVKSEDFRLWPTNL